MDILTAILITFFITSIGTFIIVSFTVGCKIKNTEHEAYEEGFKNGRLSIRYNKDKMYEQIEEKSIYIMDKKYVTVKDAVEIISKGIQ